MDTGFVVIACLLGVLIIALVVGFAMLYGQGRDTQKREETLDKFADILKSIFESQKQQSELNKDFVQSFKNIRTDYEELKNQMRQLNANDGRKQLTVRSKITQSDGDEDVEL